MASIIIRWCLSITQKSQKTYDTIRDAGFMILPGRFFESYHNFRNKKQVLKKERISLYLKREYKKIHFSD